MTHQPILQPFQPNSPHIEAIAAIWTAACGPDLALSARLVEYNTRPTSGVIQAGRLAVQDGQPVGFVLASTSAANSQASGTAANAWIDALAVLPHTRRQGIGQALLAWAEAWLAEPTHTHALEQIRLGGSLRPFTPGLPVELGDESFFHNRGYQPTRHDDWDVASDLQDYPSRHGDLPPHVRVEPAQAGQEDALLAFFQREFAGRWQFEFQEFLREQGRMSDYTLLWTERGIDGFARLTLEDSERPIERFYMHRLPRPWGQLGPLGVSRACRGQGYGAHLIDAALSRLRQAGIRGCVIDWTSLLDLYAKFGFAPYRQYAIRIKKMEK